MKNETPDWQPWVLFFLRALRNHKQRFEAKVEQENELFLKLPDLSLKNFQMIQSKGKATISNIVTVTQAIRNTVK